MSRKWTRSTLFIGIGMILGYSYHVWVGCESGGCLIASNPIVSTIYGGLMGWLLLRSGTQDLPKERSDDRIIT